MNNGLFAGFTKFRNEHENLLTLNKIGESSGSPTWDGGDWPSGGPGFSAWKNGAAQGIPSGSLTKVTFSAEQWDNGGCYDTSTSRFKPTTPGYYYVSTSIQYQGIGSTSVNLYLSKNGSYYKMGQYTCPSGYNSYPVNALVYMNGSTDYLEVYTKHYSGSTINLSGESYQTWFQAQKIA